MWFNFISGASQRIQNSAERFVQGWQIDAGAGELTITPLRPTLEHAALASLLQRLTGSVELRGRRICLDLANVERIGASWTVTFAALIDLGRRSGGLRIVNLRPQPAQIAEFLLRGVDPRLVSVEASGEFRMAG